MKANKSLVLATQAIANVVKSSFGPSGLDKMMVDDIGVCTSEQRSHRSTLRGLGCHSDQRRCHNTKPPGCGASCWKDTGGSGTTTGQRGKYEVATT